MSPEDNIPDYSIPSRPRFAWDQRNVPWTDGIGEQAGYAKAVKRWCRFHDALKESNIMRVAPEIRGHVLLANLFGRAADLCEGIDSAIMDDEDGGH